MLNLLLSIGNIFNGLLLRNATLVSVLTCCRILVRHWALRKSWSPKFAMGEVNHIWPAVYYIIFGAERFHNNAWQYKAQKQT